jgi:hypothetical protein
VVPHCLDVRQKIHTAVGQTSPLLAQSLFLIFPRTLGSTMAEMWEQLAKLARQEGETGKNFDATLKEFIACHATPEDRRELVMQLRNAVKPRNVSVQAFWLWILQLNGYVEWLPGNKNLHVPLSKLLQIKDAILGGIMPATWRARFDDAGNSPEDMTTAQIVRYFQLQERRANLKQQENSSSQQ